MDGDNEVPEVLMVFIVDKAGERRLLLVGFKVDDVDDVREGLRWISVDEGEDGKLVLS